MIAEMMPHTGGAPEASAIPIENGREIIATMIPAGRSIAPLLQPRQTILRFVCGTDWLSVEPLI